VLTNLQMSFNAIQLSIHGLQLLLNASKNKWMTFNRSLPAPDLEYVDNYKCLGVWLECKLSFQTHIKHLQSKTKSRICFLFRNKASFTHAAKHTHIRLTILLILDFGEVIYQIASNTQSVIVLYILPTTMTCMITLAGAYFVLAAKPTCSRSPISLC
jgi:hypothetical protein